MKHFLIILTLGLLTACGGGDRFKIEGSISGLQSQGLIMDYLTPAGLQEFAGAAVDNAIKCAGSSEGYTLVELSTVDGTPLCAFPAHNGDKIKITGSLDDPLSISATGTKPCDLLAEFRKDNASLIARGPSSKLNKKITGFINRNPESAASSVLLTTLFMSRGNEKLAADMARKIAPEARIPALTASFAPLAADASALAEVPSIILRTAVSNRKDTVARFNPAMRRLSLLVFTSTMRADSVPRRLRSVSPSKVVEITLGGDSASWRGMIAGDSARWVQAWLPGGSGNPEIRALRIPRLPFFIVADSAGRQRFRGSSLSAAVKAIGATR